MIHVPVVGEVDQVTACIKPVAFGEIAVLTFLN